MDTNNTTKKLEPNQPAYAYRNFEPQALTISANQPTWQQGNEPFPSMFISHGAPPLFEDETWINELFNWSTSLPKPTGIIIISAHWEKSPITISNPGLTTPLTYDFGGFHPYYYTMQYPTPDATQLTEQTKKLLSSIGPTQQQDTRGLDHGAWVPLKVMYPQADIPTIQISIPTHSPEKTFTVGKQLNELRQQGVLIIGSGFMTHGLPYITPAMIAGEYPTWSQEFDQWAWETIQNNDLDTLTQYKTKAPGMPYAHPTVEHFTPIFIALGTQQTSNKPTTVIEGTFWGLSKRSIQIS